MITLKQRQFLEGKSPTKCRDKHIKYLIYLNRIQKRIEQELDNLLFLCINNPEIFLCLPNLNVWGHEHDNKNRIFNKAHGKKRLKILLRCIMLLTNNEVQFIKEHVR